MGPEEDTIGSFVYNDREGDELVTKDYAIPTLPDVPQGGRGGDKTFMCGCRAPGCGCIPALADGCQSRHVHCPNCCPDLPGMHVVQEHVVLCFRFQAEGAGGRLSNVSAVQEFPGGESVPSD